MRDERTKLKPVVVDKPPVVTELELGVVQEPEVVDSNHHGAARLNANPNPNHFTYKFLGILSWSVLIFCFVTLVVAPRLLLDVARVIAIYMMLRFISYMFFYLGGLFKIRIVEKRALASPYKGISGRELARNKAVHHVVVIPNFNEPLEVLERTLHSLWIQEAARQHMTVVLAMEERDSEAHTKAEHLLAHHKSKFYHLMATFHPSDLPG